MRFIATLLFFAATGLLTHCRSASHNELNSEDLSTAITEIANQYVDADTGKYLYATILGAGVQEVSEANDEKSVFADKILCNSLRQPGTISVKCELVHHGSTVRLANNTPAFVVDSFTNLLGLATSSNDPNITITYVSEVKCIQRATRPGPYYDCRFIGKPKVAEYEQAETLYRYMEAAKLGSDTPDIGKTKIVASLAQATEATHKPQPGIIFSTQRGHKFIQNGANFSTSAMFVNLDLWKTLQRLGTVNKFVDQQGYDVTEASIKNLSCLRAVSRTRPNGFYYHCDW